MEAVELARPRGTPLSQAGGLPPKRGEVAAVEPAKDASLSFERTDRSSGLAQIQYIGNTLNVQRIQAALRAAERGQTWMFFAIARDMIAGFPHLLSEWTKRKMVIVGQPLSLIPKDPENPDDVLGCKVVQEAIDNCRNWQDGLQHLLDATLFPQAAAEKIYQPIGLTERGNFKYLKNYWLKEIAPVSYTTFCYEVPYRPGIGGRSSTPAAQFDPDDWESWLRFYPTEPDNGLIDYTLNDLIQPNPDKHIIHRGILQSTIVPPNWGGLIRPIFFLWLLSIQDRDWWAQMMNKYGMPIPVAKVNDNNVTTMAAMRAALALGCQLGGIAIPKNAEISWSPGVGTDGANAHKMFQDWLMAQVSVMTVGQSNSAKPEKGGMGSGNADQAEAVRDDVRVFDVMKLSDTLGRQCFRQILDINGYHKCGTPKAYWGGMSVGDFGSLGKGLASFYSGGARLTKRGLVSVSERTGLEFEAIPDDVMNPKPQGSNTHKT